MVNVLYMPISNYSKIERDEISVRLERLNVIAQILKMKFQVILTFEEKNVLILSIVRAYKITLTTCMKTITLMIIF
jgi:transcriptional regulator with XRE-family HTH domain